VREPRGQKIKEVLDGNRAGSVEIRDCCKGRAVSGSDNGWSSSLVASLLQSGTRRKMYACSWS